MTESFRWMCSKSFWNRWLSLKKRRTEDQAKVRYQSRAASAASTSSNDLKEEQAEVYERVCWNSENKNSPDTEELLSSVLHYEDFTTLEKSIFEQQQGELPGPFILVLVTGDDQGKSCETYNTAASVIEKTAGMVKVGVAQGQLADQVGVLVM